MPRRRYRLITGIVVPRADRLGHQPVGRRHRQPGAVQRLYLRLAEAADAGDQRWPQGRTSTRTPRTTSSTTEEYVVHIADSSRNDGGAREFHRASARCQRGRGVQARRRCRANASRCRVWPQHRSRWSAASGNASNSARPSSRLIVGEVLVFHVRDGLLQNGKIETEALDPIARIGGPRYARLGEIVTLKPVFQTSKSES